MEDITIQIGTTEGYPVMATISVQEQLEFIRDGYGTLNDLVELYQVTYRDWQADC